MERSARGLRLFIHKYREGKVPPLYFNMIKTNSSFFLVYRYYSKDYYPLVVVGCRPY